MDNGFRYVRRRRLAIGLGILAAVAIETWAVATWRYQVGFEQGADSALCAVAVAQDGNAAVDHHPACIRIASLYEGDDQ